MLFIHGLIICVTSDNEEPFVLHKCKLNAVLMKQEYCKGGVYAVVFTSVEFCFEI